MIPDLLVDDNLAKWRRIERAKHRVLADCERIGLPIRDEDLPHGKPLLFDFKAAGVEPVSTGHAEGVITIELSEADSVQREQTRVEFGEPQRTLVGHFRHELGHYYWERLVRPGYLNIFRRTFGDERNPSYVDAKSRYYEQGPPASWSEHFISRYAAMHPWEDFAESFNTYLDMIAVIATANDFRHVVGNLEADTFDEILASYGDIGLFANEINRDMGLLDLVPEVFTQVVREKLRIVHQIVLSNRR